MMLGEVAPLLKILGVAVAINKQPQILGEVVPQKIIIPGEVISNNQEECQDSEVNVLYCSS